MVPVRLALVMSQFWIKHRRGAGAKRHGEHGSPGPGPDEELGLGAMSHMAGPNAVGHVAAPDVALAKQAILQ
jgi:hypothetical protein